MGILLDKFDKFLVEHGSAAVRADHIAFLREQLQAAEKQIEKLEKENEGLKEQLAVLQQQVPQRTEGEFVEHRGALFKRKASGGFHLAVYCPNDRSSTASVDEDIPYLCSRCHWMSSFSRSELKSVMTELS